MKTILSRPNVLILMSDQHRADIIQPDHLCRTPAANRLMKEGITFTNAFTPMAHCCPARASLLTGLYPSEHGVKNNVSNMAALSFGLRPDCKMFSESLAEAGYRLFYTGKWHVSATENPSDRGWTEIGGVSNLGMAEAKDIDEFRRFPRTDVRERGYGETSSPGWGRRQWFGSQASPMEENGDFKRGQAAQKCLQELAKGDEPWCLFVSLSRPHDPWFNPKPYDTMYLPSEIDLPANFADDLKNRPEIYRRMQQNYKQFTTEEHKAAIAAYYGSCSMVDDIFSGILDALDAGGDRENTIIILVSDHGEYAGSHGLYAKGIPAFDEAYRVPLVIRWPAHIKNPGREVEAMVSLIDVAPTLVDLCGAAPLPKASGRSLRPFLEGNSPEDWPDAVFNQCDGTEVYFTQRFVRTKKWKLVYNPAGCDELYDLERDPLEMNNCIADPAHASVVEDLFKRIWENVAREDDYVSRYHTVTLAPFGPSIAVGTA